MSSKTALLASLSQACGAASARAPSWVNLKDATWAIQKYAVQGMNHLDLCTIGRGPALNAVLHNLETRENATTPRNALDRAHSYVDFDAKDVVRAGHLVSLPLAMCLCLRKQAQAAAAVGSAARRL